MYFIFEDNDSTLREYSTLTEAEAALKGIINDRGTSGLTIIQGTKVNFVHTVSLRAIEVQP